MSKRKATRTAFQETAYQRAELSAFRRMLTISEGTFSLSVAVCNSPALRDHIIEHITSEVEGVQVVRIHENTLDVFDFVRSNAADASPRAVFVADVEKAMTTDRRDAVLQGLNVSRELWRSRYPCPVVFWLPEYAVGLLSTDARDLWSWVSHNFEFVSEQSTALAGRRDSFAGDFTLARNLDVHEKHFRIAELEQRISDVGDEPKGQLRGHALVWLNELAYLYYLIGQLDKAEKLLQRSLKWVAPDDRAGVSTSLHNIGTIHEHRGDYEQALRLYEQAREIAEELGDRAAVSSSLHNIGTIHQHRGDYEQALRFYEQSRNIKEELGDREGVSSSLHQIGMIHHARGDYEQALRLYEQSRKIAEELGDRAAVSSSLHNIGTIHEHRGDCEQALRLYEQSRKIAEELGDREGISKSLHQIGRIHQDRGDYEQALRFYDQSQRIKEELGDRAGFAKSHAQIGLLLIQKAEYAQAFEHSFRALAIQTQMGIKNLSTAPKNLKVLRTMWGEESFDKAWREKTGEAVPEWLTKGPGEATEGTGA